MPASLFGLMALSTPIAVIATPTITANAPMNTNIDHIAPLSIPLCASLSNVILDAAQNIKPIAKSIATTAATPFITTLSSSIEPNAIATPASNATIIPADIITDLALEISPLIANDDKNVSTPNIPNITAIDLTAFGKASGLFSAIIVSNAITGVRSAIIIVAAVIRTAPLTAYLPAAFEAISMNENIEPIDVITLNA